MHLGWLPAVKWSRRACQAEEDVMDRIEEGVVDRHLPEWSLQGPRPSKTSRLVKEASIAVEILPDLF